MNRCGETGAVHLSEQPEFEGASMMSKIRYRKTNVDGFNVFYREAGRADAPALLLLHGFPSAGHLFRELIPMLSDRFRVIAPFFCHLVGVELKKIKRYNCDEMKEIVASQGLYSDRLASPLRCGLFKE